MRIPELAGRRVAIWGFGREGRAAVAAIRRTCPDLPLTVLCAAPEVPEVQSLADPGVVVDTAPVDGDRLARFDVIVKSPGISPHQPAVAAARAAGVTFTSGSALWFAAHRDSRTVVVTATKGKSTTTSLIAHLLRSLGVRTALAGNIGLPLLELPEAPHADAVHVIELSSFQAFDADARPTLAVVCNLLEEHLDWHGTVAQYRADKMRILDGAGKCLLNAGDPVVSTLRPDAPTTWYGQRDGWHVSADSICHGDRLVLSLSALSLPGRHNAENACAALAAVELLGFDAHRAAPALATFRPLPHRLQVLGRRDGIDYINDSIATTPAAASAALAFARSKADAIAQIVGGHDRHLDWSTFLTDAAIAPPVRLVFTGPAGARVHGALDSELKIRLSARFHERFDDAFADAKAWLEAMPEARKCLLLSPGAPSFGAFRDYAERGRRFIALAGFESGLAGAIEGLGWA